MNGKNQGYELNHLLRRNEIGVEGIEALVHSRIQRQYIPRRCYL